MSYTVVKKEKGVVEVNITLPAGDIDKAWDQVLVRLGKSLEVPGFRSGNAPLELVLERVGTGRVYNEVASDLITRELAHILKTENLTPLDNPQIKIDSLEKGKDFVATVTFSQKPKVEVESWQEIRVSKVPVREVSEEDVDKSLTNIFEAWKKKQAEDGKEGSDSEDGTAKPQAFIYDASGNKIFVEDKETQKPGESKIDDQFAQKLGARDLAHLRELVKNDLVVAAERAAEREFENELFDKLLAGTQVEVPEVLVEDEISRMLVSLNQEVQAVGMNLEDYLKRENKTVESLKSSWRVQAEKNVKLQLALDQLAHALDVKVTPEELSAALSETDESKLTEEQKTNLARYMTFAIIQSKTLALLKQSALGEGERVKRVEKGGKVKKVRKGT